MIILGIDPGINVTGFGIIEIINKKAKFIMIDTLFLTKNSHYFLRLKKIFKKTLSLIDMYHPNELAIESYFLGKNVQSIIKLGQAQGMAISASLYREIPITEYSTRKIKMSITGNGSSSKEQVAKILKEILNIEKFSTKNLHASDGLATAVCHYLNSNIILSKKQYYNGWNSFIQKNIDRIKK